MAMPPCVPPPDAALASLPPGWSEHLAPTGQLYYYNSTTATSTYTRPSMRSPNPVPQPTSTSAASLTAKEKPLYKIPIPDTPWLRVKTNHGNIFFTRIDRKESVWSLPEEIVAAVADMDWAALEEQAARDKEVSRVQKEIERDSLKRKAEDASPVNDIAPPADPQRKPLVPKRRKTQAIVDERPTAISEINAEASPAFQDEGEENGEDENSSDNDSNSQGAFSGTSAEEAWQLEMAEGLATLAKREGGPPANTSTTHRNPEVSPEPNPEQIQHDGQVAFKVPDQVNLSPEEARTLFKTLLTDKNPNPLAPFASIMPMLITDPRYILLSSQSEREAAFNEWCRETARKARLTKLSPIAPAAAANGDLVTDATQQDRSLLDPAAAKQHSRDAYESLLKTEVSSTRLTWDEFRRKWKKDRRFFSFGRDEREREKVFRIWLKDLGERKRAQAQKAELDFMGLLRSKAPTIPVTASSQWKDVKRSLVEDPRYDAVGSSTLREELFNTFLKALASGSLSSISATVISEEASPNVPVETKFDRRARTEKALRDRREQARLDHERIQKDIGHSKAVLTTAESETELMSFFVDAVREPTAEYQDHEATLNQHTRFSSSPLPPARKRSLFHCHIAHLREKYLAALHALFLSYSPSLSSKFSDLTPEQRASLGSSLPAQKLGFKFDGSGASSMRREWEAWLSKRTTDARAEFQKLLEENSFIEFWGKVSKLEDVNEDDRRLVVPGEEDLEMNEMGGGPAGNMGDDTSEGKLDLKTLAKSITEKEIERVLKNDQRYRAFDHVPEHRMRWVKDYLSSLSAPARSVHVQPQSH